MKQVLVRTFRPSYDHFFPLWLGVSCAFALCWVRWGPHVAGGLGWMVASLAFAGWLFARLQPGQEEVLWASEGGWRLWRVGWMLAQGVLFLVFCVGVLWRPGWVLWALGGLVLVCWLPHARSRCIAGQRGVWLLGFGVDFVPYEEIREVQLATPYVIELFTHQGYFFSISVKHAKESEEFLELLLSRGLVVRGGAVGTELEGVGEEGVGMGLQEKSWEGELGVWRVLGGGVVRRVLGWVLCLVWSCVLGWMLSLGEGGVWGGVTFFSLLVWLLGLGCCVCVVGLPPDWFPPGGGVVFWEVNRASRWFWWLGLPSGLLILGLEGWELVGLLGSPSLYESSSFLQVLFLLLLGFFVVNDPTASLSWVSVSKEGLFRRQLGWGEWVSWSQIERVELVGEELRCWGFEGEVYVLSLGEQSMRLVELVEEVRGEWAGG